MNLQNRLLEESLTPAVRGDYAEHNCPLDQYVRLRVDATMVGLLMNLTGVALDVSMRAGERSKVR